MATQPVDRGRHVVAPAPEVELLRSRYRRVTRRLRKRAFPEEILRRGRHESRLREPACEVVVERAAPEDVVDDQDAGRGRALGKRDQRRHPLACFHRDKRVLDAHVRQRRSGRDLGVAHQDTS